jgi:hypothetical protein
MEYWNDWLIEKKSDLNKIKSLLLPNIPVFQHSIVPGAVLN